MTATTCALAGTALRTVLPVHSRYEERWHDSVGWFITNAVLESEDSSPAACSAVVREAIRLGSWPLADLMAAWGGMPEAPGMFAVSWLDMRRLPVRIDTAGLDAQYVSAAITTSNVMLWFIIDDTGVHLRCRYPDTLAVRQNIGAWLDDSVARMRELAAGVDRPPSRTKMGGMSLSITGDPSADRLLTDDPFALLIGMLLDQQMAMEAAFAGPAKILDRVGSLDPAGIAAHDPESFEAVFRQTPAVHRYPGSMAGRVQALAAAVRDDWAGDAAAIWTRDSPDGSTVLKRLKALPGFGEQKAKIFLALLGKQYGYDGARWCEAAGDYGRDGYRSVADITSPETLTKVREFKREQKAAAKAAKNG